MMTEQRLQEIDEGSVPEQRAIDECVTEIRRLRAALTTALAERDALFNSAWALLNDEPQANGEYVHAVTCSADRKKPIGCGGCSCQLGRRIKLLASALTEARSVLQEMRERQDDPEYQGDDAVAYWIDRFAPVLAQKKL